MRKIRRTKLQHFGDHPLVLGAGNFVFKTQHHQIAGGYFLFNIVQHERDAERHSESHIYHRKSQPFFQLIGADAKRKIGASNQDHSGRRSLPQPFMLLDRGREIVVFPRHRRIPKESKEQDLQRNEQGGLEQELLHIKIGNR